MKRKNKEISSDENTLLSEKLAAKTVKLNEIKDDTIEEKLAPPAIEFDIKQLRKDLNVPGNDALALNQFLSICINPDCKTDYMLEYLENGGNAHEILRQITNKKNLPVAGSSLHIFQLLLVKVQTIIPHLIPITEEASRYFLNNFQSTIEMMLSEHSSSKHKKIILKLLASMVTLNPELGIEILNQFPTDPKRMSHLAAKGTGVDQDTTRMALIQFLTSFTIDSNLSLLKALLEKHGLFSILIPGMIHDDADTALMMLNILKDVVDNSVISKTLKLHTFNHQIIVDLFKLFSWIGPKGVQKDIQKQSRIAIADSLHKLLFTMCTSSKYGVYFNDPTLGTGDIQKNQNVFKALQSIKRPWESEKQFQLVLAIISTCPEFTKCILHGIEQAYHPKDSTEWHQANLYLREVVSNFNPHEILLKIKSFTYMQIFNYIKYSILPIGILKQICNLIDANYDISVVNELAVTLFVILTTLYKCLNELKANYDENIYVFIRNRVDYFLKKHFPSLENLVKLLNKIICSDYQLSQTTFLRVPHKTRILINMINLVIRYFEVQPQLLEITTDSIDTDLLLNALEGKEDEDILELKVKVVTLFVRVDKYAISPEKDLFKNLLIMVMQAYVNSENSIHEESKTLLKDMLIRTNLFDENLTEIDILLHSIKNISSTEGEIVFKCITDTLENSFMDINKYKQFLTEAIHGTDNNDVDAACVNLDELFDSIDVGNEDLPKYTIKQFHNNMSVFLVGLLKYSKQYKSLRTTLNPFISNFTIDLLHLQELPTLLIKLTQDFKLDRNLKFYIESWTGVPQSLQSLQLHGASTISKISHSLINEEKTFTYEEIFSNTALEYEEVVSWINLIIFYISNEAYIQTLNAEKCEKYKNMLDYILRNLTHEKCFHNSVRLLTAEKLLSHRTFSNLFVPASRKRNILLTEFLLYYVEYFRENGMQSALKELLKAYQKKLFFVLNSELTKAVKKGKGSCRSYFPKILNTICLSDEDYITILNQLVNLDVSCFVEDETEPATWLDMLVIIINKHSFSMEAILPSDGISRVTEIYSKLLERNFTKVAVLEQNLCGILKSFPQYIENITVETFNAVMNNKYPSSDSVKLATLLLEKKSKFAECFETNLTSETLLHRELILSMGSVYILHKSAKVEILQIIFDEYSSTIKKILDKPQKASQSYVENRKFVANLIYYCMSIDECINIIKKQTTYDIAREFHVELFQAVAFKILLHGNDADRSEIVNKYFLLLLNFAVTAMTNHPVDIDVLEFINLSINTLISFCMSVKELTIGGGCNFDKVITDPVWQNYCKQILKFSLKQQKQTELSLKYELYAESIRLLTKLMQFLYPKGHDDVVVLFEMLISHSEFLNIMLSYHSEGVKARMLEFLLSALIKNKSVMKSAHIPVYLSAYRATMCPSDRLILAILHAYESNGQPMHEYQPYLWGDAAASHYSVRRNRSTTLWGRPTPNQVLNLLEREKVALTVKHFPVQQKMNYIYELPDGQYDSYRFNQTDVSFRKVVFKMCKDGVLLAPVEGSHEEINYSNVIRQRRKIHCYGRFIRDLRDETYINRSHSRHEAGEEIYDPFFLLPLLSHIIAPESVISCFKIVRSGVLSICIMAMSSECATTRIAAYYVLSKFYALLEADTKHKKDKFILSQFINTLKSSLAPLIKRTSGNSLQNPRLPAISAMYLARALAVINAPFDALYTPVNNYLIARSYVDFSVVPDLMSLLHDCSVEHTQRRQWILQVIIDGTKTAMDGNICFKSMLYKMLLDLYSSVLSDKKSRRLILEFVQTSLSVPKVAEILINGHGVLSWLSGVFRKLNRYDMDVLNLCVEIVETLWYSTVCNSLNETLSKVYVNVMNQQSAENRVRILSNVSVSRDIETAIVSLMLDLLPFANIMSAETFVSYFCTMKNFTKSSLNLLTKSMLLSVVDCCHLQDVNNVGRAIYKAVDRRNAVLLKSLSDRLSEFNFDNENKQCISIFIQFCLHWL